MAHWLLINGWGMPPAALEPLHQALQAEQQQATILSSFLWYDALERQHAIQAAVQADVIMGWSHGGQLAAHLAQALYEQTGRARPLICVASNPKFVAASDWPYAMPIDQFQNFQQAFQRNPTVTLQRFARLCLQGEKAHTDASTFLSAQFCFASDQSHSQNHVQSLAVQLTQQLQQLADMDTRQLLQHYQGAQFHLFAQQDALIPSQVAQNMQLLPAKFLKVERVQDASHAFLYWNAETILQKMMVFLRAAD